MRIAAILGLAVALIVAGALVLRNDSSGTGIRGRVTRGCIEEGCRPVPKSGLQLVRRWDNSTPVGHEFPLLKRFWSAPDGTFEVNLPPGHYLVEQDPRSPVKGMMKPLEVFVRKGEFKQVDPFYDVGMRGTS